MSGQKSPRGLSKRSVFVVCLCALLLLVLIVPAINQSRLAARRTQSRNNLRQLAFGVHNHHDVYGRFPRGARISDDGVALHGWYTMLLPYLASSSKYQRIDRKQAWDHSLNRHNFVGEFFCHDFGVEPAYTAEGFGTQQYLANPNVLHRNSKILWADVPDTANTWLLGEARPPFAPWGYPFSWRELTYPLNQEGGYGAPWGGAQFAMADGSVRFFSDETSEDVIVALRDHVQLATPAQKLRPTEEFLPGLEPEISWLKFGPKNDSDVLLKILHAPDGTARTALRVFGRKNGENGPLTQAHLSRLVGDYPDLREVFEVGLTDDTVAVLGDLRRLETLSVRGVTLSDEGMESLRKFGSLKVLRFLGDDVMEARLRDLLPDCELHRQNW